ncbi:Vacuolar DHA amino acid exporter [Mycena chlorophos]|uniref:Vacuolar DHA amino acid exporter n=1 Tax=Mycena chlorophos TaxID=658473 RepID=A0A8H6WQH6_MYCCL|nr:Vacuolar DHA amino acid exporter [Mycena chlorophos]
MSTTSLPTTSNDAPPAPPVLDIEHMPVTDDPRAWSNFRKNVILFLVSSASMIAGLASNIQNPAIGDMERDLPATSSQISLSLSLFIAFQGSMPLLWTALSEIKGRKLVYVSSIAIFVAASAVVATSKTIALVIVFRVIQATGSSAVMAVGELKVGRRYEFLMLIGAATLADIFEPAERGTKMGIYYIAPLLGPSLAPIMGGVLTTAWNWRAPFWFLTVVSGLSLVGMVFFFKDTFRKERSLTYQAVLRTRLAEAQEKARKSESKAASRAVSIAEKPDARVSPPTTPGTNTPLPPDVEKQEPKVAALPTLKLSLRDVNPITPLWIVMRRLNNIVILFASGLIFAFNFVVVYSASRELEGRYGYNALETGFVLLSFGIGNLAGSLLGGRYSDRKLAQLKAANGGVGYPEMRLHSTTIGLILLPPSVVGFAWVTQERVHVAAMCVFLFLSGFFVIWAYTSTLAYIVDANKGRSSTAVAANSCFRGIGAFAFTEIAVPLQNAVGDGWQYTIWAVLLAIVGLLVWLVAKKGGKWREAAELREQASQNQ